ncbi:hypothetical protein HN587_00475 [Candidatus Woesearchaeota archaeon]|jgi:hypothetical protein|nr:hypothetical protein [Candidatus Woesearchaeota archaeon]
MAKNLDLSNNTAQSRSSSAGAAAIGSIATLATLAIMSGTPSSANAQEIDYDVKAQTIAAQSDCKITNAGQDLTPTEVGTISTILSENNDVPDFDISTLCSIAQIKPVSLECNDGYSINEGIDHLFTSHPVFKSADKSQTGTAKKILYDYLTTQGHRSFDQKLLTKTKLKIPDEVVIDMYRAAIGLPSLDSKKQTELEQKQLELKQQQVEKRYSSLELKLGTLDTQAGKLMQTWTEPSNIAQYIQTELEGIHSEEFGGKEKPKEEQLISAKQQALTTKLTTYSQTYDDHQAKLPRGIARLGGTISTPLEGDGPNAYGGSLGLKLGNESFDLSAYGFMLKPFPTQVTTDFIGGGLLELKLSDRHRILLMLSGNQSGLSTSRTTSLDTQPLIINGETSQTTGHESLEDSLNLSEFYMTLGGEFTAWNHLIAGIYFGFGNLETSQDNDTSIAQTDTTQSEISEANGTVLVSTDIGTQTDLTTTTRTDVDTQLYFLEGLLGYTGKGQIYSLFGNFALAETTVSSLTQIAGLSQTQGVVRTQINDELIDTQDITSSSPLDDAGTPVRISDSQTSFAIGARILVPYDDGLFSLKLSYDNGTKGLPLSGYALWAQNFSGITPLLSVNKTGNTYSGQFMLFTGIDDSRFEKISQTYDGLLGLEQIALDPTLVRQYSQDSLKLLTTQLNGLFLGGRFTAATTPNDRALLTGSDDTDTEFGGFGWAGFNHPEYAGGALMYDHTGQRLGLLLNINAIPHVPLQLEVGTGNLSEKKKSFDASLNLGYTF